MEKERQGWRIRMDGDGTEVSQGRVERVLCARHAIFLSYVIMSEP